MISELLLAGHSGLRLEAVDFDNLGGSVTVVVSSRQSQPRCPVCAQSSEHIHSHYQRTIADLPCSGRSVRLELTVRKLFCDNDDCERVVFTERLPDVVTPWARRTARLADEQRAIAQDLGGEAGARASARQGMAASPDTLLRLVHSGPKVEQTTPRVLGVDDWALRKGQAYGTILVDLEAHKVVDLLPDRSPDTLEKWLKEHPGVEVISRDRANAYADGSSRGAPKAIQVADRFHLLQNLRQALERLLDRNQAALQATTKLEARADACSNVPKPKARATDTEELSSAGPVVPSTGPEYPPTGGEQARDRGRARRHARYDQVVALRQQGSSIRAIASRLSMSPRTVRRFVRADGFPERAQRQRVGSILDPYMAYLHQQMVAGRDNGMQLWREIRDQGYPGSRVLVSRWVAQHRQLCPTSKEPSPAPKRRGRPPSPPRPKPTPRPLSARQGSWFLVTQPERLTDEERAKVDRLCRASSDVASGYELGQGFAQIVRQREVDSLDAWLGKAKGSGLADFERFAAGIERDHAAVAAALSLPWSNGQTEGQVNRLTLVKRQMYGRASFDLLRLRVLAA